MITILSIPVAMEVGLNETPKDSINDEWIQSLKWLSQQNNTDVPDYYSIYKESFSYPQNISTVISWWTSRHWILVWLVKFLQPLLFIKISFLYVSPPCALYF